MRTGRRLGLLAAASLAAVAGPGGSFALAQGGENTPAAASTNPGTIPSGMQGEAAQSAASGKAAAHGGATSRARKSRPRPADTGSNTTGESGAGMGEGMGEGGPHP